MEAGRDHSGVGFQEAGHGGGAFYAQYCDVAQAGGFEFGVVRPPIQNSCRRHRQGASQQLLRPHELQLPVSTADQPVVFAIPVPIKIAYPRSTSYVRSRNGTA